MLRGAQHGAQKSPRRAEAFGEGTGYADFPAAECNAQSVKGQIFAWADERAFWAALKGVSY